MNDATPACEPGDVVYVRAWWDRENPVKCEVMRMAAGSEGCEDYLDVKPLSGNPHRRFVGISRLIRVLPKGTVI